MRKILLALFLLLILNIFVREQVDASVLFEDNFNDGTASKWTLLSGKSLWKVQNLMFGARINTPSTIIDAVAGNINVKNYIIEMDILPVLGVDRNIDVRWINNVPHYEFHFNGDYGGSLYCGPKRINYILTNNIIHHLMVKLLDDKVELFVDNDLLCSDTITNYEFTGSEQIGLKIGTGAVYPTEVWFDNIVVKTLDQDTLLNVPYFSQNYDEITSSWGDDEYDHAASLGFSDITMDRWGCAVTSAAMILNYHGMTNFGSEYDNKPVDPGSLNEWLKKFDNDAITAGRKERAFVTGYNDKKEPYSSIVWGIFSVLTKRLYNIGKANYTLVARTYSDPSVIDESLEIKDRAGYKVAAPPILKVIKTGKTSSHYVVATGKNENSYAINDPEGWGKDLSYYDNNNFIDIHQYLPSKTNLSNLQIVVNPEVELLIIDQQGRKTGKTIENNQIKEYKDIPNAVYKYESPISNPDETGKVENFGTGTNVFYLPEPDNGDYKVQVSSPNNNGFYVINIITFQSSGEFLVEKSFGQTGFQNPDDYRMIYSQTQPTDIKKNVTFETILLDIEELWNVKFINKEPIKNHLVRILESAQQYQTEGNVKLRDHRFLQFENILSSHRGDRELKEEAYQILYEDLQQLKNTL